MTADEQRDPPEGRVSEPGSQPNGRRADRNASTQVGQVFQELGRLTRRLPTNAGRNTGGARASAGSRQLPPSRERLAGLIAALGDTNHPQHLGAVDELVDIGTAAVPVLNDALGPQHPWLTSYRAAEALGQIGDGRAASALSQALKHPNGNVRWSAVRALAHVGDARTIFQLRRVAQNDRGKTSWGEPVAGAAQSALDQLQIHSPWSQALELIKTAVTCVLMILALVLAFSVVTRLRDELNSLGRSAPNSSAAIVRTAAPPPARATQAPQSTAEISAVATVEPFVTAQPAIEASGLITGTAQQSANVRAIPSSAQNEPIGVIQPGDQIVFVAVTANGQWYRVRLGEGASANSQIDSPDGTGWVNATLLTPPRDSVPLEEVAPSAPSP